MLGNDLPARLRIVSYQRDFAEALKTQGVSLPTRAAPHLHLIMCLHPLRIELYLSQLEAY
jgi:hypothetical protein